MVITDIKTYLVCAQEGNSADRPRGRNWLFVRIETDAGISGVGEGGGWPAVVEKAIHELKPFLIGEKPHAIEHLWHKLYHVLHGHGVTGAVRGGAISAIDMALWDIKGKSLDVPVYELLGGKMREAIPVYGHASSADGAKQLIDAGYRAFKCSPSARTLEELRSAVGWEVEIGVHCHGQFSPASAIQLGKAIEPFRPAFFEDPVIPEDIEAIAKVAEKVNVPIATGERFATKWAFTELLSRKLVDLVQPETTRLGGITELKKLAAMAEAHSVKVAPHDGSVGPIVEMANVHVMATIPNCYFLEHKIQDVPWRYEVAPGAVQESGGEIRLPDTPGLGVDVDEAVALAHQTRAASDFEHRHSAPEETTRLDTQW